MQSASPFDLSLPVAIALLASMGNDHAHDIAAHVAKYDLTGSMKLPEAIGHWIAFGAIEQETRSEVYESTDAIRALAAGKFALQPGDEDAIRSLWHTLTGTGEDAGRDEDFRSWASGCEDEARGWTRAYWRSGAELVTGAEAQGAQAAHDFAAGDGVTTTDLQSVRGFPRWEQEARSAAIFACDEDEEGRTWQHAYQAAWLRSFEQTCNDIAEDFLANL